MVVANKMKNQRARINSPIKTQKNSKKASLKILDTIKKCEKKPDISKKVDSEKENKSKKKALYENLDDLLKEVAVKPKLTSKDEKKFKKKNDVEKVKEKPVKKELTNKKINKSTLNNEITTKKLEKNKRKVPESEPSEISTKKKLKDSLKVKSQKLKVKKEAEESYKDNGDAITSKIEKKKEKKSKVNELKNKNKDKMIGNLELNKMHVEKAVDVVFQLAEKEKQEKTLLLPFDNNPIFLQINCIKIPKVSRRRIRLSLPYVLLGSTDDVALFVPDVEKGRRKDYEKTVEHWETIFREKGVTRINAIIPMNQVKTEYNQYEMRRKLARLHDFFLVDGKITGHLTHLLGKTFTRFASPPVPLRLHRENLKEEIEKALKKTTLEIHGYGPSHTVQIATLSMPPKKIVKNALAVCEKLKDKYPGGFDNIRSILIKTKNSLAIPIYYSIKSRNDVPVPTVKPKRPKAFTVVEGELSTAENNVKVSVTPSGRVTVIEMDEPKETEEEIITEMKKETKPKVKEMKAEVKKAKKKNVIEKKSVEDKGKIVKHKKMKIKMEK